MYAQAKRQGRTVSILARPTAGISLPCSVGCVRTASEMAFRMCRRREPSSPFPMPTPVGSAAPVQAEQAEHQLGGGASTPVLNMHSIPQSPFFIPKCVPGEERALKGIDWGGAPASGTVPPSKGTAMRQALTPICTDRGLHAIMMSTHIDPTRGGLLTEEGRDSMVCVCGCGCGRLVKRDGGRLEGACVLELRLIRALSIRARLRRISRWCFRVRHLEASREGMELAGFESGTESEQSVRI